MIRSKWIDRHIQSLRVDGITESNWTKQRERERDGQEGERKRQGKAKRNGGKGGGEKRKEEVYDVEIDCWKQHLDSDESKKKKTC